jgi:hypothetical protein
MSAIPEPDRFTLLAYAANMKIDHGRMLQDRGDHAAAEERFREVDDILVEMQAIQDGTICPDGIDLRERSYRIIPGQTLKVDGTRMPASEVIGR